MPMSPETIAAVGTAIAAVAVAVGSKVVDLRKAEAEGRKLDAERKDADEKAEREAEARKDAYRDAFITTLQAERAKLVEEAAAERAKLLAEAKDTRHAHGDCLQLVGELTGRVESLEVQGNATEVKLRSCMEAHALAASDARTLREKVATLERRSSDPALMASR